MHRRLRILVWLVALLLLQVRIASAVCFPSAGAAFDVAMQCCEAPGESIAPVEAGSHFPAQLWSGHCARSVAPQQPEIAVVPFFAQGWIIERSFAYVRAMTEPTVRLFLTGPYPTGPHLIYLLQRLLI